MAGMAVRGHDTWVAALQEPLAEARKMCDALGRDDPLRRKIEPELLKCEDALAEGGSPEPGRLYYHHPMELVAKPRLKGWCELVKCAPAADKHKRSEALESFKNMIGQLGRAATPNERKQAAPISRQLR